MLTHHKRAYWPFAWDTGRHYAPLVRPISPQAQILGSDNDTPGLQSQDSDLPDQQARSGHALGSFGGFMCVLDGCLHGLQ